jgi:nucleoid DNA-binding protein
MSKAQSNSVSKEDLIPILHERTGVEPEVIETILRFFERLVLHAVKRKKNVLLEDFIVLYHIENELHVELTTTALKIIKK